MIAGSSSVVPVVFATTGDNAPAAAATLTAVVFLKKFLQLISCMSLSYTRSEFSSFFVTIFSFTKFRRLYII
jgi:hypothetical protein